MAPEAPPIEADRSRKRSGRVFAWITAFGLFFAGLHVVLHLTWFGPKMCFHVGDYVGWFTGQDILVITDVRCDYGPNTWLSVLVMLWTGVAAFRLAGLRDASERKGWILVGVLFVYLGMDDALMIHEMINDWARQFVGDELSFPWIKVLLPIFVIAGLFAFRFLAKTLWNDRPRLIEMALGFACLGGAVGFEIVERWLKDSSYRPRGFPIVDYPVVPEEFLEVLGPALLLLCFMRIQESERVASPS
jgi:hypothetical protein